MGGKQSARARSAPLGAMRREELSAMGREAHRQTRPEVSCWPRSLDFPTLYIYYLNPTILKGSFVFAQLVAH